MLWFALATVLLSDGGVPDRPSVIKLENGSYVFSPAAFSAVDNELKRLQVELDETKRRDRAAKAVKEETPPWVQVVLVSAAVGLAAGLPVGFLLGRALPR